MVYTVGGTLGIYATARIQTHIPDSNSSKGKDSCTDHIVPSPSLLECSDAIMLYLSHVQGQRKLGTQHHPSHIITNIPSLQTFF